MKQGRHTLGRILIGSAIGAVLGLILLAMGIAIVLNALEGRSRSGSDSLEVELQDRALHDDEERLRDPVPDDEGADAYDDRFQPRPDDEGRAAMDDDRDEASAYGAPAYPRAEAGSVQSYSSRRVEALPPQSRSQWRSIFDDDAPSGARLADPAPRAMTPAPAPQARAAPSAPRSTPRTQPQPNRDEESLFY